MGKRRIIVVFATLLTAMLLIPAIAGDDFGMDYAIGIDKKLNQKMAVEVETEFRTRNDAKTADRWSLGIEGSYKALPWLKLCWGYVFLYDHNHEKITYNPDGDYNNWRPSYWGTQHRFYIGATASYDIGRLTLSLRERYQFTHRPEAMTDRYDFDNVHWEETTVRSKNKHVLRSRLEAEYNIRHCPVTPWVNVELFNDLSIDKTRLQIGADYKMKKKHVLGIFYRFQDVNARDDDNECNTHMVGLSYKYKL